MKVVFRAGMKVDNKKNNLVIIQYLRFAASTYGFKLTAPTHHATEVDATGVIILSFYLFINLPI